MNPLSTSMSTAQTFSHFHETLALKRQVAEHPLWDTPLLTAARNGTVPLETWRHVFGQYYFYSRSFSRFLTGAMTRCEDDFYRAKLAQNLAEESGEGKIEKRHSEIFRDFLKDGLDIHKTHDLVCRDITKDFVDQYVEGCLNRDNLYGAAFLSLGTEGIVPRLYTDFVSGLTFAGVNPQSLHFFNLHIKCDDEHAVVLEELMNSYAHRRDWFTTCSEAADAALNLRKRFFEQLVDSHDLVPEIQPSTLASKKSDLLLPHYEIYDRGNGEEYLTNITYLTSGRFGILCNPRNGGRSIEIEIPFEGRFAELIDYYKNYEMNKLVLKSSFGPSDRVKKNIGVITTVEEDDWVKILISIPIKETQSGTLKGEIITPDGKIFPFGKYTFLSPKNKKVLKLIQAEENFNQ